MADGLVSLLFVAALPLLVRALRRVRSTTLRSAGWWAVGAWGVWLSAWVVAELAPDYHQPWGELLWYLAGLSALCPFVAVLGAKRPGVRVWPWFVLLPLVLVFTLPVTAAAWPFPAGGVVRVPLPLMIGFAVVLLMGAGNYVGTRYAVSSGLAAVGICLVIGPLSDAAPAGLNAMGEARLWGTGCAAAAVLLAARQSSRPTAARSPLERLWFDYRDTYGIVWARRLLERVNQRAEVEGWNWRLSDNGFVPVAAGSPESGEATTAPEADARIEHTFRWLIRRFADPEWIDARLAAVETSAGDRSRSRDEV